MKKIEVFDHRVNPHRDSQLRLSPPSKPVNILPHTLDRASNNTMQGTQIRQGSSNGQEATPSEGPKERRLRTVNQKWPDIKEKDFDTELKLRFASARFGSGNFVQSGAFFPRNLLQYQIRISNTCNVTNSVPGHHSFISSPNCFIPESQAC